jgi:hypothetical protein
MFDSIATITLYYDPNEESPREDSEEVRERVSQLAERERIEYEEVNVDEMGDEEFEELYQEVMAVSPSKTDDTKPYAVDNRVLGEGMFGGVRPVLRIEYHDETPPDILPHQNDHVSGVPIGILDFLDNLDEADDPAESYFATFHPTVESTKQSDEQETDEDTSTAARTSDSSDGMFGWIRSIVS